MEPDAPPAATPVAPARRLGALIEPRERVVAANQLLLCAIVVGIFVSGLVGGWLTHAPLFGVGVLIIILTGIAALAVPWSRLHPHWIALLPLVDVLAIGLLRAADAAPGLGLLWAFPAMWLSSLGAVWFFVASVSIVGSYWILLAVVLEEGWTWATIILPAVIVAVGATSYSASRRSAAQRALIESQTARLTAALRHANRHEQLLAEVLDTVDFGVLRLDPDGELTFVNEALGRFQQRIPTFGSLDPDVPMFAADGRTPVPPAERPLARVFRGETFQDELVWFPVSESRRAALSLTARQLPDAAGQPGGIVLVARDVTEQQTALRARDTLVASVSHELRTPLTSILGYLELVLDEEGISDETRRHVDVAYRNGERLLGIVAGILAASTSSRLSAELTLSRTETDVAEVLGAAASDIAHQAAERAIRIETDDIVPAPAFIDAPRIRQVVDNLLSNAIKFNRDGGTVTLGCATDGTHTWFLVRDSGIGLDPEDRDRVFERFFRAESGVPGTGLGLAISREIVLAHGGDISVTSTPGLGSTFMVRLPASVEVAAEDGAAQEETPEEDDPLCPIHGDRDGRADSAPDEEAPR